LPWPKKTAFGIVAIVPDAKWPNMYRLRFPDGRLTGMVNLTRAKDALDAMKGEPLPTASAPALVPDVEVTDDMVAS
jgi:hypothetical protein